MSSRLGCLALLLAMVALPRPARSEVVRVVVDHRELVLDGKAWGEVGAYEKLVGRIFFAFDPANPANARIVDLALAPRNGEGRVEAWAEFMVLQPRDAAKRSGVAWLEVGERGGKAILAYLQRARGSLDPKTEAELGDGLLFRSGHTVAWVGWQWDVPDGDGLVRLHVPFARDSDGRLEGLVRADWVVDEPTAALELAHRGHRTYAAVAPEDPDQRLTARAGRDAPAQVVPRDRWRFVAPAEGPESGRLTRIELEGGFEPGLVYELVYRSSDPRVVGLGLAAVRDVMSHAKYALDSPFPVRLGIAFGASQGGRFLRHFLYQGFNVDEGGRKVFDGMLVHGAGGGRGSFNHRFAQPSRGGQRYASFFYPTDLFPFTSRAQLDPVTGLEEGLLDATPEAMRPLVMYTNTGYEYWGRSAALAHVSIEGAGDVAPLENERIYHLAGGQRHAAAFPPTDADRLEGLEVWRGDPLDFRSALRALQAALVAWIGEGTPPPPSAYPTLGSGTLVSPVGLAFPAVPGLAVPRVAQEAYRADYGPRFRSEGIVDREPPVLGAAFPVLIPQVDGLGNEMGGVRALELRVPVATYAPWSLRWGAPGGRDELTDFVGTFAPLPATDSAREARGDPRPSLERLYGNLAGFLARVDAALAELAGARLLLAEDAASERARALALWTWVAAR